jgi:hypothetical protein
MLLQLLSDLHLESEAFEPEPAPGAELLVLGGDIDATWAGLERFRDWPVPVLFVAGNHEFDGRELTTAWPALRDRCGTLGLRLLECESVVLTSESGLRVRFVCTTRWCDLDLFGVAGRERALRAAGYFMRLMGATREDRPFDAAQMREEGLLCRRWLETELRQPRAGWDCTVAVTHFAPSLRSADPRYGAQPGTASFCNADDDLMPLVDLWIHGHLHCRNDYLVQAPPAGRPTRVVCNARGLATKGEDAGFDGRLVVEAAPA